jgi:AcrR family transcriptional regulator
MTENRKNITHLSTRDRRRLRNRKLILNAAQELLNEKGLENLTLTDIAERAAYSKPAVYEYFEGVEDLLYELSNHGFIQFGEKMQKVPKELAPDERMIEYGKVCMAFARNNAELYKLMFTRVVHDPREKNQRKSTQTAYWLMVEAIEQGIETGIFKTRPGFELPQMAYLVMTVTHGMASMKHSILEELDLNEDKYISSNLLFLIDSLKKTVV